LREVLVLRRDIEFEIAECFGVEQQQEPVYFRISELVFIAQLEQLYELPPVAVRSGFGPSNGKLVQIQRRDRPRVHPSGWQPLELAGLDRKRAADQSRLVQSQESAELGRKGFQCRLDPGVAADELRIRKRVEVLRTIEL